MNVLRLTTCAALVLIGNAELTAAPLAPLPARNLTVLEGHQGAVSAVAWSADGKILATASNDRTVRLWNPATGKEMSSQRGIARAGFGSPVVAFTPDLKVYAVNYWGAIAIRSVENRKVLTKIDPILDRGQRSAFRPDVFAMAFSPDGKKLATAGSVAAVGGRHGLPGGIVIVWDVATGKIIHKSAKLSSAAHAIVWSADGTRYVAGTNGAGGELPESGEVWMWDAKTGKALKNFRVKPRVEQGEWASAGDVALDPKGQRVAVPIIAGGFGKPAGLIIPDTGASIRVWNLTTGKSTQPMKRFRSSVDQLAFSPDGERLATAGKNKVVHVWDMKTGKELAALECPNRIGAIAFCPDGKTLAVGCKDGSVRIWAMRPAK